MELRGFDPRASCMRSKRSTKWATAPRYDPHACICDQKVYKLHKWSKISRPRLTSTCRLQSPKNWLCRVCLPPSEMGRAWFGPSYGKLSRETSKSVNCLGGTHEKNVNFPGLLVGDLAFHCRFFHFASTGQVSTCGERGSMPAFHFCRLLGHRSLDEKIPWPVSLSLSSECIEPSNAALSLHKSAVWSMGSRRIPLRLRKQTIFRFVLVPTSFRSAKNRCCLAKTADFHGFSRTSRKLAESWPSMCRVIRLRASGSMSVWHHSQWHVRDHQPIARLPLLWSTGDCPARLGHSLTPQCSSTQKIHHKSNSPMVENGWSAYMLTTNHGPAGTTTSHALLMSRHVPRYISFFLENTFAGTLSSMGFPELKSYGLVKMVSNPLGLSFLLSFLLPSMWSRISRIELDFIHGAYCFKKVGCGMSRLFLENKHKMRWCRQLSQPPLCALRFRIFCPFRQHQQQFTTKKPLHTQFTSPVLNVLLPCFSFFSPRGPFLEINALVPMRKSAPCSNQMRYTCCSQGTQVHQNVDFKRQKSCFWWWPPQLFPKPMMKSWNHASSRAIMLSLKSVALISVGFALGCILLHSTVEVRSCCCIRHHSCMHAHAYPCACTTKLYKWFLCIFLGIHKQSIRVIFMHIHVCAQAICAFFACMHCKEACMFVHISCIYVHSYAWTTRVCEITALQPWNIRIHTHTHTHT